MKIYYQNHQCHLMTLATQKLFKVVKWAYMHLRPTIKVLM